MKRAVFLRIHWIVAALPTAIAVVYLSLVWLPGYSAITALQDQVEYERQFVAQAADLPAMLAGCQRDLDTAESVVARWEKDAPRSGQLAPHFEKIDAVAREAGLAVTRFAPQPVVVHEKIHEIPLVIDCSGRFAQVHEFLRNIERLPAAMWIESIKIESPNDKAKNVKCKITLVAFTRRSCARLVRQGCPHDRRQRRALGSALVAANRSVDAKRPADHGRSPAQQDARPLPIAAIRGFATLVPRRTSCDTSLGWQLYCHPRGDSATVAPTELAA